MSYRNMTSLGNCVELVIDHRGLTPKKLGGDWADSGYRAISAKNIKDGQLVNAEQMHVVSKAMYGRWMREEVQRGDVFITSEAPFGEVLHWQSDDKIVLSQRVFGLRFKPDCDSSFLFHYMRSQAFRSELDAHSTGTTVIGLRQPELMKCQVWLPTVSCQRRIGYILDSLDDYIYLLTRTNGYLAA